SERKSGGGPPPPVTRAKISGALLTAAPVGRGRIGVTMAAKLALIVRADLGMGRGKIAAQVAHAAVAAVLATSRSRDFAAWLAEGQPKVVLKVSSAEQLLDVARRARAAGLPVEL